MYQPTRSFATGGHVVGGDGTGAGGLLRARVHGRLGFDLVADVQRPSGDARLAVPLVARLVGFQRLSRTIDFLLAVGPTLRPTRDLDRAWATPFGFECALGLEALDGSSWIYRAELAGYVADDHGVRTQGLVLRIGVLGVFRLGKLVER